MAAISAHSPRTGTIEAFAKATRTGAEYVEFDIRRTADGELAAYHDAHTRQGDPLAAISYSRLCDVAGYPVPRVGDVMATIAGKATGHLDLKDTGGEEKVVQMALDILGPGNFVVTTLEDRSVAAVKERFPAVPAALSLGRDLDEVPRGRRGAPPRREVPPLREGAGCHPAERAPPDAKAAGLPGRLGGGAPPPGGGRRAGAVPPGRDQGDGLD